MTIKKLIKKVLPATAINFIKNCRYRGLRRYIIYLRQQKALQLIHDKANHGFGTSKIAMMPGLVLNVPADFVHHSFSHFTYIEPDMVKELKVFVDLTRGKRCLLDVGALHGLFSLVFTGLIGESSAIAFEPDKISYSLLTKTLAVNPKHNVKSDQLAIGSSASMTKFRSDGLHLVACPENSGNHPIHAIVSTSTIDIYCHENSIKPDTIKIDVEGYEYEVLKGARHILELHKPLLFIEVHPALLKEHKISAEMFFEILDKYIIYDMDLKPVTVTSFVKFYSKGPAFRIVCAASSIE